MFRSKCCTLSLFSNECSTMTTTTRNSKLEQSIVCGLNGGQQGRGNETLHFSKTNFSAYCRTWSLICSIISFDWPNSLALGAILICQPRPSRRQCSRNKFWSITHTHSAQKHSAHLPATPTPTAQKQGFRNETSGATLACLGLWHRLLGYDGSEACDTSSSSRSIQKTELTRGAFSSWCLGVDIVSATTYPRPPHTTVTLQVGRPVPPANSKLKVIKIVARRPCGMCVPDRK